MVPVSGLVVVTMKLMKPGSCIGHQQRTSERIIGRKHCTVVRPEWEFALSNVLLMDIIFHVMN